ncbi:MAG: DUF1698 domain-containing protein [Nitrosarchaeum sp.]|nr:DUF1698 domain-containing protein [Nitrosarchaeum sp.]
MNDEQLTLQISLLYKEILDREPDESGLSYYIKQIKKNKMSLDDVHQIISNSEEAQIVLNKKLHEKFSSSIPTFKTKLSSQEITDLIKSVKPSLAESDSGWYHSFRFGDVSIEDGTRSSLVFQMRISQNIPDDLSDMTILDIGPGDGFYSFLCEMRGAKKVLAIDNGDFSGFDIAKKIIDSKVEYRKLNLYELEKIDEVFDYVLCFGVYYHLPDVVLALQKIHAKTKKKSFLSGPILSSNSSIMCLYDEYELHPLDHTNWWVASPSCIKKIAKRVGFTKCELIDAIPMEQKFIKSDNPDTTIHEIGLFELTK